MELCQWSQNRLCQVFVAKGTDTKISCNGLKDRACLGRISNIEDTRDRGALKRIISEATEHQAGWGGKRKGAGAPRGNLNRLVHGRQSKLIRKAVEKLAADNELRAFLLFIARAATEGEIPDTTKAIIRHALETSESKTRRAVRRVSQ